MEFHLIPYDFPQLSPNYYSLVPKLWWKSLFMKQSSKLKLALKDPKPATIHFSYVLQLKEDWGCPKKW